MKVLICEPDPQIGAYLANGLEQNGHQARNVSNGKEAQNFLGSEAFDVAFINLQLSSYSAIEVVKFIRFKNVKARIVLGAKNDTELEEWIFGKQNLKKLGIRDTLLGSATVEKLDALIKGFSSRQRWREVRGGPETGEKEVKAFDDQFTSIKIDEFFCGNLAIFDIYVRLGRNKYLKILNQGEAMERERLENYRDNKNVSELYFLTKDRKVYINFLNDLIRKTIEKNGMGAKAKAGFMGNLTRLMVQEIYAKGIDRDTLDETLEVCENAHKLIESMPSLKAMLNEYIEYDDSVEGHLSLTMIYADAVSQNIGWVGERSRSKILMGALLHDIGKLKLPASLRSKKASELSGKSLEEYRKHCVYGAELLDQVPEVGEPVKQIALQHHEFNNGEGFPNGLSSSKIYPPAKIVGFANRMAELSVSMERPPYEVLRKLVQDKTEIFNYDPEVVRAFIKCFAPENRP